MRPTMRAHHDQSRRAATSIDKAIAAKLREKRRDAGLSQEQLAEALGVTFQQVQKYEYGTNRLSGGRLCLAAAALGIAPAALLPSAGER